MISLCCDSGLGWAWPPHAQKRSQPWLCVQRVEQCPTGLTFETQHSMLESCLRATVRCSRQRPCCFRPAQLVKRLTCKRQRSSRIADFVFVINRQLLISLIALARLAKRDGDISRARELWESALGNSREGYEAYEQLAIYYEHEVRDPRRALTLAREALNQLCRAKAAGTLAGATYGRTKARFEHRMLRLERKASRTLLDPLDA